MNVAVDAGQGESTIAPVLLGLRALSLGTLVFAAAGSAALAPFQCAGAPKPEMRREEEPAEALYNLAEQFKAKGAEPARVDTLRYLVKMYPTSRFAESARLDLEGLGAGGPASPSASAVPSAAPSP